MCTNINLCEVYNLVHILEGDKWKTTIQTHYGKYIMMPFGLTNATIIFKQLTNNAFQKYWDNFMACYIDNILNLFKNMEDHEWHGCFVFNKLKEV